MSQNSEVTYNIPSEQELCIYLKENETITIKVNKKLIM